MDSRILRVLYASFVLLSHLSEVFAVNLQVGNASVRCTEKERQSLLVLKQGFVDRNGWLSSWGNGENQKECCTWEGVHCSNQKSHVVKLDLRGDFYDESINYLEGTISSSLANLHHLNYLDLSSNNFSNLIEFPKVVNSLTHLKYLNLSNLFMRGKIPFELRDLFRLEYLDLYWNIFEGEIPTEFGNLSRLVYLDLGKNNLTGTIPYQLGNLFDLQHLDLGGNQNPMFLRSNLKWMSHLTSLNSLSLDYVDLGSAENWIQLVSNLSLLQELHLSYCNLTNTEFLSSTFNNINSSSLAIVDLSYNNLTSLVFPWLLSYRDSLNYLDLSGSFLRSNLEWISHLTSLNSLSLGLIDLGSTKNWIKLVSNLSLLQELHFRSCNLTNSEPWSSTFNNINFSSLAIVDLSNNNLTSSVFPWLLGYSNSLTYLELSNSQLSGPIPEAFRNFTSLQELYLDNNQLEGGIPKLLLDICSLRVLHISANNLSGRLEEFVSTSNRCASKSLQKLYLSHNRIAGSVPDLSQFSSLKILYLDYNQLNGTLSDRIGQLLNLTDLILSHNSLQGEISEAHFSRLSKLQYLDLSFNALVFNVSSDWVPPFQLNSILLASCKLGPTFPMWLQTQKEYIVLDISSANISNTIPYWFWKSSPNLGRLNLSYNHIRGKIPNLPLESFIYLDEVDLSWNMFEGPIPSFLSKTSELLYVSNNQFSEAHSFLCANTTSELDSLDLSNNQFIEELPECWTNFKSLTFLDLRNNKFFGHIPSSMGALTYIQALHLGKNNLTGTLTQSISNCT